MNAAELLFQAIDTRDQAYRAAFADFSAGPSTADRADVLWDAIDAADRQYNDALGEG